MDSVTTQSVTSVWRYGVSVVGIIPYRGVYFGLYDTLREKNPYKDELGAVGLASKFVIAQTTALAAGYAAYPFDTVRRRLQLQVCGREIVGDFTLFTDELLAVWKA